MLIKVRLPLTYYFNLCSSDTELYLPNISCLCVFMNVVLPAVHILISSSDGSTFSPMFSYEPCHLYEFVNNTDHLIRKFIC